MIPAFYAYYDDEGNTSPSAPVLRHVIFWKKEGHGPLVGGSPGEYV
ncbi:hypothetical protein M5E87_25920 [Flavonifractor plautii]|nr:hypothetical protein M5E87_25920 [Flavonifractor plautii]